MKDGILVHRTRRRRVAVRVDVLPELVAVLSMHLVWARRAIAAAVETAHLDPTAVNAGQLRHWQAVAEAIEEIISRSSDTMDEVEYALCLEAAERSLRKQLATPRPRSGRRLEIPRNVNALTHPGRRRPLGPGDDRGGVPPGANGPLPGGAEPAR